MARQYYTTAILSENQQETPEGYLLCLNVPIARTGALIYAAEELTDDNGNALIDAPAGRAVVSRTPEVLFDSRTIASFEGKPVTLMHPTEMLTPENWKDYAVGVIQNVRPGDGADGDKLMADLMITDSEAIFAIRQGLREVSLGYDAQYVEDAPGVGHQTTIIGNHCALVPAGRCGPECAIQDQTPLKEIPMGKLQKLKEQLKGFFTAFDAAVDELEPGSVADPAAPASADPPATGTQDADLSAIVADMQGQLAYCKSEMDAYQKRMETLEAAISKLSAPDDPPADTVPAPAKDAAPDADTLARAEILAPGIAATADIIPAALKAAYATTDGKAVIDTLAAGSAPDFDSRGLFVAASELLKSQRKDALVQTRTAAPAKDAKVLDQHAVFNKLAAGMFPIARF